MLIQLTVGRKSLDGEDGFKDSSWEVSCRELGDFLAYALQLNRPRGICLRRRRRAMVDLLGHKAGNGWGTGENLDKVGSRLVRRDNLGGGNAPGFPIKRSSTSVMRGNLKT